MSEQGEFNFDPEPEPEPEPVRPMLDAAATRAAAEDGMRRALYLTDEQRKQEYRDAIWRVALMYLFFSADEVWEALGEVGDGVIDDGSGLGPILTSCCRAGIMEPYGVRRSIRPSTHGRNLTLWRSLIFNNGIQQTANAVHPEASQVSAQ